MSFNVLVLGGHGNFGGRICRALSGDSVWRSIAAAPSVGALEPDFHRRCRVWFALVVPAFVMMFRGYWM